MYYSNYEDHRSMFRFIKVVGRGGFGSVWEVQHIRSGRHFALKVMSKACIIARKSVTCVMNQRKLHAQIDNPFIVNMRATFQDRQNLYMLMDILEGGDLRYHINMKTRFTQVQVKFIVLCIMKALKCLHEQNILHRDIKPQNIIFENTGYCRVTDLGIARVFRQQNRSDLSGTPGYMAPEIVLAQNHTVVADYFAVGVIAYELIVGKRPYFATTRSEYRDQVLERQAKVPGEGELCSLQCTNFINKLLCRKPIQRLGARGIDQIFDHPWLEITPQENQSFNMKLPQAPWKPKQGVRNHSRFPQDYPQTPQQKSAALLLKRDEFQQKFKQYNFNRAYNIQKSLSSGQPSARLTSQVSTADFKSDMVVGL